MAWKDRGTEGLRDEDREMEGQDRGQRDREGWRDRGRDGETEGWRDSGRMVDSGKKGQEGQRDIGMDGWIEGWGRRKEEHFLPLPQLSTYYPQLSKPSIT
jgi:hypothetical protein